MIYKAFAGMTLIAAPFLVIAVESFTPHSQIQPPGPMSAVQPVAPAVMPTVQPAPPPPISGAPAVTSDPASFAQPMPDAGKPTLTPGNGLPSANPQPVSQPFQPGESGPGNPGNFPSASPR